MPDTRSTHPNPGESYEPPLIEDLDTSEGPSVTAATASTLPLSTPRTL